jgi:hypothetical protein
MLDMGEFAFILHPSSFILQLGGDLRPCRRRATLTLLALSETTRRSCGPTPPRHCQTLIVSAIISGLPETVNFNAMH